MKKRKLIIGNYDTALHWTLCECKLGDPEQDTHIVKVPGGGILDFSTALTDGEPVYYSRPFNARLECSEGTRKDREGWISEMVNQLDGYRLKIVHPDHPEHYLLGSVRVLPEYNDLAHASVKVTATCEAWLYKARERSYTLTATEAEQTLLLTNRGRKAVVPTVTVTGEDVVFSLGSWNYSMAAGTYTLTALLLRPGDTLLTYSGDGQAVITYREAVLR